jgi:hypothetical protein
VGKRPEIAQDATETRHKIVPQICRENDYRGEGGKLTSGRRSSLLAGG